MIVPLLPLPVSNRKSKKLDGCNRPIELPRRRTSASFIKEYAVARRRQPQLSDNMQTSIPFTFFLVDNHLYPRSIPEAPTEALHEQVPRPPTPSGPPTCCGGRLPASVVNKLNKLSVRSGLFKIVGEFGLRENLYYGSIFICMTLIVIVCFLVINNRGGAGLSGLISGSAAAYDGGTAKFFRF